MYAMNYKQVGSNIRKELAQRNMTQQGLADELKISKQVMNKIVNGLKAINVNELIQIASILGISTDELLQVNDNDNRKSSLNFMGKITNDDVLERIKFVISAIDDICFLEDLIND